MIELKSELQGKDTRSSNPMDINMILTAMSQISTQISTQFKEQDARMTLQMSQLETRLSTQLEEQHSCPHS